MDALQATLLKPGPGPRQRWLRRVLCAVVLAAAGMAGSRLVRITLGGNLHTVLECRVYRAGQLSGPELESTISNYGIRTVVNLRGIGFGMDWYRDESRAVHRSGVSLEDVNLSAGRLPSVTEVRRLVRVLDRCEYPILVHCKHGSDRTGLTSALILLLYTDTELSAARRQLGLQYGHVPLGRTAFMGRFFDLYECWLATQGLPHRCDYFRRWLEREYSPGPALAELHLLEFPSFPPRGKPWTVSVRATNRSAQTWQFRPGTTAGVHCGYLICDAEGRRLLRDRAGRFRAEVPPGDSIDLTLLLPAIHQPGTYYLMVDMLDEQQQSYFYQHGSEPLLWEFVVDP
jgi:protein tyrosine phosphatase (PTP) superfamily phosphohydrolase (DUF442 family)